MLEPMREKVCARCRLLRTALLCTLLGGAAGFGVLAYGGSADESMAATFLAALMPVLWYNRQHRLGRSGSE